jgi:23S rRNA (guanosine2251-2'-O)-methyltransferase
MDNQNDSEEISDQVEGRNSVLELLESGKDINKIIVAKGEKHGSINKILAIAKERKIVVVEAERQKLGNTKIKFAF